MNNNGTIFNKFFTSDDKYRLKRCNDFFTYLNTRLNISKNKPKNLTLNEYI